ISCKLLLNWDINMTIGQIIHEHAPVLGRILGSAAQSNRAIRENKIKDISMTCHVILAQLAKARSNHTLYFTAPFTLFSGQTVHHTRSLKPLQSAGFVYY
ncbi:hypothetical protein EV363DRAFT_1074744, partial [Boletus edulis]